MSLYGIAELRALCATGGYTREGAFEGFTAEECVRLLRACRASPWDMFPDQLRPLERRFAATHGRLSAAALRRMYKAEGGI